MSGKQARGRLQSECKLDGARRTPFADITNEFKSRLSQHDELSSPPTQSRTLNRAAMQIENGSRIPGSVEARNSLAETGAPLRNTRSSLPVKAVSGVPPVPLFGSVLHPKGDLLRSKPSRRQTSLGSGALAQYPNDPDLCGDFIDNVLPYDAPDVKLPLPSHSRPSPREPLSTSLLPPKTHKLAGGQLAILPSRSVLVDFREGERRTGRKGDEVMVVSPNGDQVKTVRFQPQETVYSRRRRFIYLVPLTSVLLVVSQNPSPRIR